MHTRRKYKIQFPEDDILLFVHIPKTGGLSFIHVLDQQFKKEEIFPLHSAPSPELFEPYTQKRLEQYKLVRGHFRFGPYDQRVYKHLSQNPIMITMLRDPVQRTISAYRYILRTPERPLHSELVSKDCSLMDFVCDPTYAGWVENRQARVIFGGYPGFPFHKNSSEKISDEAILHICLDRIQQFALVGLTERFRDSVDLLTDMFGWETVTEIPRMNVTPESDKVNRIEADVISAIKERTQIDQQLYVYAEKIMDSRLDELRHEGDRIDP